MRSEKAKSKSKRREAHEYQQDAEEILLSKMYPVCVRLIPMRLLPWVLSLGLVLFLYQWLRVSTGRPWFNLLLGYEWIALYYLALIVLLIHGVSITMYVWSYHYWISKGTLYVARGVAATRNAALLISEIARVLVTRSMLERLFGLCTLEIIAFPAQGREVVRIEGLTENNARSLRRAILDRVDVT